MAKSKTSRVLGWVMMGFVMVGLLGFGASNFGSSVQAIGQVGKTPIDANRYARELQRELNQLQAQFGERVTMEQAQLIGIDRQVLSSVISTVALEDETARLGISVGDEVLRDRILEIEAFKGIDGKFDRNNYSRALEFSGLSESEFEQTLRAEVSRQILQRAVLNANKTQPIFADILYGFARERRNFTWAKLEEAALISELPDPSEADLTAYYEKNSDAFMAPETKDIAFIWIDPNDLIEGIAIEQAQIDQLYEERFDEFNQAERRMVDRLVYQDVETATQSLGAVVSGAKTFEELVVERELTLADVDLGDVDQSELGEAGASVFVAEQGQVVGPMDTVFGPALFRVNAIFPEEITPIDAAHAALKQELARDVARRQISDMIEELDDMIAGGATLEDVAQSQEIKVAHLTWSADVSVGIAAYDEFRDAATQAQEGDFPEIVLMDDGGIFALRVDGLTAAHVKAQDLVSDEVKSGWLQMKTREMLKEQAAQMLEKFADGESPASLGLVEVVEDGVLRQDFVESVPSQLLETVFEATDETWQVIDSNDGIFLARLDDVVAADQNSDEAEQLKADFLARSEAELALDLEAAISNAIETAQGVQLDQAMINAVNGQFN